MIEDCVRALAEQPVTVRALVNRGLGASPQHEPDTTWLLAGISTVMGQLVADALSVARKLRASTMGLLFRVAVPPGSVAGSGQTDCDHCHAVLRCHSLSETFD